MQASAGGAFFEQLFLPHFTCRLVLFRFADVNKDAARATVLASADFRPGLGAVPSPFTVERFLGSTQPGANFAIGNGLGVAIIIEKTSPGNLNLPTTAEGFLRIHSVSLTFNPRPRDESVTV